MTNAVTLKVSATVAVHVSQALRDVAAGRATHVGLPGHFSVHREGGQVVLSLLNLSDPEPAK